MKQILVVENETEYLESIELMLQTAGYEVLTADNGYAGFYLAEQSLPDLIISDVVMPGLSGLEMLQAIRGKEKTASIPVIFLTGVSEQELQRHSMSRGVDDFLSKAISRADLLDAVKARLGRAENYTQSCQERLKTQQEFFSLIAHDLRGPLTTIRLSLDAMSSGGVGVDPDGLARMESASETISLMVDRLLAIGRSKQARIPFKPEWVTLRDLCERSITAVAHHQLPTHRLVLKCQVVQSILADPFLICQILTNLLSNALKYSPYGGQVTLEAFCGEGHLHLVVADEGVGIPANELPWLFNKYYRCASTREIEGIGLGLSAVKLFAVQHGGNVECESQLGRGSRFTVKIPLEPTFSGQRALPSAVA